MAEELEELFGEGGGTPRPRARLVWALLATGTLLALAGLACTSAPGAVVVLFAWMVVEKDADRLETGYLPADVQPQVQRMRTAALACLGLVIAIFVVQGLLTCGGFYELWWGGLLTAAR